MTFRLADAENALRKIIGQGWAKGYLVPKVKKKKRKKEFSDRAIRNARLNAYMRPRGFGGQWRKRS